MNKNGLFLLPIWILVFLGGIFFIGLSLFEGVGYESCLERGETLNENQCVLGAMVFVSDGKMIDLYNCESYFDGCNMCNVENGKILGCTKMFCANYEEPRCVLRDDKKENVLEDEFLMCGGIAGIMCPEGYSCELDGSYPDASGVCLPTNSDELVCTMEYDPQCGANGVTYTNLCFAGGEVIAYSGECGDVDSAFSNERICTMEYNPQCGADGITYSNPCMAGEMTIIHSGEC